MNVQAPRPTIGFLSANIHVGASRALWRGVLDAAATGHTNLICFPGGRLHASEQFEAERNSLYNLVDPAHLDGLVSWTSALAGIAPPEEIITFHQRYRPLLTVSLAYPLGHGRLVSIDGYQGMRALIFHLVDVHAYSRIALIRAPESHPYAQERYHAFLDALKEKGLTPDPALISPAVNWEQGAAAMRVLLDERGLRPGVDFQAVVAASDLLAIGALSLMTERGIRVPSDVAVAGFNDIEEGRLVRPPLTSVSLPFYEQGRRAVEILLAALAGETTPEHLKLDSQLLVRQSCGCPSWSVRLAAAAPDPTPPLDLKTAQQRAQAQLVEQIARVISNRGVASTWAKQLLDSFIAEIRGRGQETGPSEGKNKTLWPVSSPSHLDSGGGDGQEIGPSEGKNKTLWPVSSPSHLTSGHTERSRSETSPSKNVGQFQITLNGMLQHGVLDGDETAAWQTAISVLRRELLPALTPAMQHQAEDLFGQARVVIGEAVQRAQIARQLQAEQQNRVLRDIGEALITAFDVAKLADVLTERLPDLGIASCYLALYDDPELIWSRLVLAYDERGRAELPPHGRRYPSRQVVPPDLLPPRRFSLLVEPLHFQTEPLGFVVFEVGPHDGDIYEVLRGHISSALKGTLLFQQAHEARLVAERADQIKTRLLANVSHELRTPLNIIIGHSQRLLEEPPPDAAPDLAHIQHSAEHQLRIINDLLDLSRAEINALDLYPTLLDPRPLIEEAFAALAKDTPGHVLWQLEMPDNLPLLKADPVRLRQILLNLLSNAAKFTEQGQITLGVELARPHLHLWVADTGPGIPSELAERVFEPFASSTQVQRRAGGIGLGLSITRHLVALHEGTITVASQPGQGTTFHLYFPLPEPTETAVPAPSSTGTILWLISNAAAPPAEMIRFSQQQGLQMETLRPQDDLETLLARCCPAVVAWDMAAAAADDWHLMRRLHNHPQLSQVPFILYQQEADGAASTGLTSLTVKPASSQALWEAIRPTLPQAMQGSVLIVDDDPHARQIARAAVVKGLPDYTVRLVENGQDGVAAALADPPNLIILDLMMPQMDGFTVLDHLRANEKTRHVPVVILSGRQLSLDDVKRLEQHAAVTLQAKGLLSQDEIITTLHRSLFGTETLPPQTSALVKQAAAYLHQNYARSLARWEIAAGIGVSEDYLSRVFHQELGISPWDYLNRYRIAQAKEQLRQSHDSISQIAHRTGFPDPAYFSRVFRRLTGMSPRVYRDSAEN